MPAIAPTVEEETTSILAAEEKETVATNLNMDDDLIASPHTTIAAATAAIIAPVTTTKVTNTIAPTATPAATNSNNTALNRHLISKATPMSLPLPVSPMPIPTVSLCNISLRYAIEDIAISTAIFFFFFFFFFLVVAIIRCTINQCNNKSTTGDGLHSLFSHGNIQRGGGDRRHIGR
jgi:hypothetical protein